MDEILRMIDAFQTSDEHKVATPANWDQGMKLLFRHQARRRWQKRERRKAMSA